MCTTVTCDNQLLSKLAIVFMLQSNMILTSMLAECKA